MLELHYPTVTKTILERQYSGKPTSKVAFGNGNGAIFENSSKLRASLFVTSRWPRSSGQTNYQVHPPPPPPAPSLIKLIHYGDVPLDRIWFITSLSQRVNDFVRVCQQGISCMIDLICGMNFVCSPSTQK